MMRLVLVLLLALASPALAQAPAEPAVTGRVVEVFANRLILELGNERVLAEPADAAAVLTVRPGDAVRVEGERHGPILRWRKVMLDAPSAPFPQGQRLGSASGNSDADLLQAIERLGLKAIDPPLRKRHHIEVLAQTAEGRKLYVSFDRDGRLWEIEDATYDRDSATPRNLAAADYERLAREAGFSPVGSGEERRRHVELEVRNRAGEPLTLHIDKAGVIYKQVWRR